MLRNNRTYLITSVVTALGIIGLGTACGSSDDDGGGGDPQPPDEPCTDCETPPAEPAGAGQGDGDGTVLAASAMYLGDTDRNGTPSPTAWKAYGYDLDGFKSNANSVTHCQIANETATKSNIQTDGNNGIDNSFGANLVPVITGLQKDAAQQVNEAINEGTFTIILEVEKVGGGTDYVGLPAALYAGAEMESPPVWDGNDEWPVFCELMQTCQESGTPQLEDGNASTVTFPTSYMVGGTWVSGSKTTVSLSLSLGGFSLALEINQAVITADMSGGNPPTTASNGIIAGVVETSALIESLAKVAGSISTSLCKGPTFESVKESIEAASDIMKDGSQKSDAKCDGISVGLGFDMKAVQLGEVLDEQPPGEDPCADQ